MDQRLSWPVQLNQHHRQTVARQRKAGRAFDRALQQGLSVFVLAFGRIVLGEMAQRHDVTRIVR